ncbi:cAMP-dependent protein kinase inhibitor alpha [Grus japonensis]|uniref:cAMP-dependent protein kinase inhibitor alpha n=1 Tax=Grus japonensis TaxID=30415 RepID=A0ABC9W3N1_GRUJA
MLLEDISKHMEDRDVIIESQPSFTKGKSCLTNLVAFYDGVTASVDKGRATDVICVAFYSRIECSLSRFADDTKLSGTVDMAEGRDSSQRDLDRLEEWAHVNLIKFNKAKCKVLQVGQGNPQYQYRLGEEWIKSCSVGEDLGMLVNEKLDTSRQCALASQKANCNKKHGQQAKGFHSPSLLSSRETPPGVLHPANERH